MNYVSLEIGILCPFSPCVAFLFIEGLGPARVILVQCRVYIRVSRSSHDFLSHVLVIASLFSLRWKTCFRTSRIILSFAPGAQVLKSRILFSSFFTIVC